MSADILSSRAMQWASKVQSIADQARELTLEAAQSVGARYIDETKPGDIHKLLEGRSDREKIDGMRRTIASSSRGIDMSEYFASVVKNAASPNLELRKLVYIYISKYAESQPDLALLSINTIQKAMSDQNQIVRALAVRVLSNIRVTSISGIALLAIQRAVNDSSPYVRRAAALAIVKTHTLEPSLETELLRCLRSVLADTNPGVLASAIDAYGAVSPDRVDLLHSNYRRICGMLTQFDHFSIVNILAILENYARHCFTAPELACEGTTEEDFYKITDTNVICSDHLLLLRSVLPLLQSQSSAVVIATCRLLSNLAPKSQIDKIVKPLLTLLRQPSDVQYIVLNNIKSIASEHPVIWQEFPRFFLIHPKDPKYIWTLKLDIMSLIIAPINQALLLAELSHQSANGFNDSLAQTSIRTIGQCAKQNTTIAPFCMQILFEHLKSGSPSVIEASVIAIRQLVQLDPSGQVMSIKLLAKTLPDIAAPAARASVFWLISENLSLIEKTAPDVLRMAAKSFTIEAEEVRTQILTLAIKMYVRHCSNFDSEDVESMNNAIEEVQQAQENEEEEGAERVQEHDQEPENEVKQDLKIEKPIRQETVPIADSVIPNLYAYICQLTRYDVSYDLRDRLRTYKILASSPEWILTRKILFSEKPKLEQNSTAANTKVFGIGSSSMMVNSEVSDYRSLRPWSDSIQGQTERETVSAAPALRQITQNSSLPPSRSTTPRPGIPAPAINKPASKLTGISSLDDFYATTSEDSSAENSTGTASDETEASETGSEDSSDDDSEESDTDDGDSDDLAGNRELLGTSRK